MKPWRSAIRSNDLAMIEAAGLGVAYRAKPVVAAQADTRVDHADLGRCSTSRAIHQDDFVTDWKRLICARQPDSA